MKLKIKKGRIVGIEDKSLKPVMPNEDLSFVEDKDLYKEIRNYMYSDHNKLENKLVFQEGVMKGSNPYLAVAVDMFSKKYHPEYRVARQVDLEQDPEKFSRFYVDSGLALRSLDVPNGEQAKLFHDQLKQRNPKIKLPVWIDLQGLEFDENLNFKLTDKSRYKTAPCLNWQNGQNYSQTDDFGLPKETDKTSSRQIWTEDEGLEGYCLNGGSYLSSRGESFDYSNNLGRVVLVK